jgi:hypothetical protein
MRRATRSSGGFFSTLILQRIRERLKQARLFPDRFHHRQPIEESTPPPPTNRTWSLNTFLIISGPPVIWTARELVAGRWDRQQGRSAEMVGSNSNAMRFTAIRLVSI